MDPPLVVCEIARALALDQRAQAAAVERAARIDAAVVVERRGEIERGDRIADDVVPGYAWPLDDQSDAQQTLVVHRPFEQQAVIAEPVTVVGRVHHDGVVGKPHLVERGKDPADVVVDQGDHAVVVGDHVAQLHVGLRRHARALLAVREQVGTLELRLALEAGLVPPRPALEILGPMRGQVHCLGNVQPAPRLGRVERMMRIGK